MPFTFIHKFMVFLKSKSSVKTFMRENKKIHIYNNLNNFFMHAVDKI